MPAGMKWAGWHAGKNFNRRVEMGGGGMQGRTSTGGLNWAGVHLGKSSTEGMKWEGVVCREELPTGAHSRNK